MSRVSILRQWPDGDTLKVSVAVDASYPDALAEASATAKRLYAEALDITVTEPLSRPLATGYTWQATHSAVVDLANVTLTETARTSQSVTIKVQSVGLALVAGTLIVMGVE